MQMEVFHFLFGSFFGVEIFVKFSQNIGNLVELTFKTKYFLNFPNFLFKNNFAQKYIEAMLIHFP
jgi:hypothetical protein